MDNISGNTGPSDSKKWADYTPLEKAGVAAGVLFIGLPYSVCYKTPKKILSWTWNTALPAAANKINDFATHILVPFFNSIKDYVIVPLGTGLKKIYHAVSDLGGRLIRCVAKITKEILLNAWQQAIKPLLKSIKHILCMGMDQLIKLFRYYI